MNVIKKTRKEKNISLNMLSESTGLSVATLNRYEKKENISSIPINNLDKIAKSLGTNRSFLLGEDINIQKIVGHKELDKSKYIQERIFKYFDKQEDYEKTIKRLDEIDEQMDEIYNIIISLNNDGINQIKTFCDFLKQNVKYYDENFSVFYNNYRTMIDDLLKDTLEELKETVSNYKNKHS